MENKLPSTLAEARQMCETAFQDERVSSVNMQMSWGDIICVHRDGRYTMEEIH